MRKASWMRRHLSRLDSSNRLPRAEIYFITCCTHRRVPVLTRPDLAPELVVALGEVARRCRWVIGRYVIMPDHVHFFCCPSDIGTPLPALVGRWKSWTDRRARAIGSTARLWQREFFDHLLRSEESYDQKWQYVRDNPVRAGLCRDADEWPWQGEITPLDDL